MENRFLIDTHIFIWLMENNRKLSAKLFDLLKNPQNSIYLSVGSIWEMIIKVGRKKLKMPDHLEFVIRSGGITVLPVELKHILEIKTLPPHHFDPFDRLLIAQSLVENLTLISADPKIWRYKVKILKA